ncbi:MAG: secondary thiamine-phosphate synthase enzyme YjbQ [Planctomycetota bacterium]
MPLHQTTLAVHARRGTTEITERVAEVVRDTGFSAGTAHVFCRHTSCSLVLMENADPSARRDLEAYFDRLVPEDTPYFTHTAEGPDDMPSHIKMALTRSSETIPFADGRLLLGTWQGLFLWEHRDAPHRRELVVTVTGA